MRYLGEKDGVTLRIYTRPVTAAEEKRIIANSANKNRMQRSSTNDLQQTVAAESNLQDVAQLAADMHRNREPLLHTAVFLEMISDTLDNLRILQTEVQTELVRSKLNVDRLMLRQQHGFMSVMPSGRNMFREQFERVLPASSVANLYPFSFSGKTDENGFYLGRDKYGSNIIVDFDIAKAQNIRLENLRWYAAFHNTSHHPHIHLLVYSTDIKEGFLTENGIEQIKSAFANDIFHNELYQLYKKQTNVRDKLRSEAENVMKNMLCELQNNNQFDPQLEQLVLKLQSQLKNSKGKKVYGYLQPNVKRTVDQIVAQLAENLVLKKMYNEWCALEQQKYETYTSTVQKFPPLEENKVFKPIKNAVIQVVLGMDNPVQKIDSEMFVEVDEENLGEAQSSSGIYIKWTAEYKSSCEELYKKHNIPKALELFRAEAEKGN